MENTADTDMQVEPSRVIRALAQQIADQAVENAKLNAVIAGLLEQRNADARATEEKATPA